MYKIIFIDIDGTLRDNKRNLSQKTIDTIKKVTDEGIFVVLCSGRPRKYTEEISRKCFASKYIITSNGANIYDYKENKILYSNIMDKKALIELYDMAIQENVRFIMDVGEHRVVNIVKHPEREEKLEGNIEDFVYNHDVVQCIIADEDFYKIKKLVPQIDKLEKVEIKNRHKSLTDPNYPRTDTIYCDVGNIGSNKGNAVQKLCKYLTIDLKNAIAIGDSFNDLSMFEKVGYSVAMGNANEEIKEKANEVTLSNDDDGVAVFLEKLLNHEFILQNSQFTNIIKKIKNKCNKK